MLPLLKAVGDKAEHRIGDLFEILSNQFDLTEEERELRLPSGRDTYIKNRIAWAKTYLKKAGLISSPQKGTVKITAEGLDVIASNIEKINNVFLQKYESFNEFRPRTITINTNNTNVEINNPLQEAIEQSNLIDDEETPEEAFERAHQSLRKELAAELLETIKESSPYLFENIVIDLMLAMGYGGSREDAGEATKRSADGGIDGIIKLDRLGLDKICLQAKRYTSNAVGEPEIRDFIGALEGARATKGVFITTSKFTDSAIKYVEKIEKKIILINGDKLASLMIDFNVGVSTAQTYQLKKIDSDYFL
jgi:restriction system protein